MKKIITLLILLYSINNFSQSIEKKDDNIIYSITGINVKPEFPGGLEKLDAYINDNLPKAGFQAETKATKAKAKAYAMFVVEKDGSLSDIKILGKVDSHRSEELIRILKSLPKWSPGKQSGQIVRVLYTLPVVTGN